MKRTPLQRSSSLKRTGFKKRKQNKNQVYNGRAGYTPTTSRQNDWRKWATRTWAHFLHRNGGDYDAIVCMCGCRRRTYLQIDHVIPRSNFRIDSWNPCNSQLLHASLNMEKGSQHGKKWDFRSYKYKIFQRWRRALDWKYNTVTRHWELREKKNPPAKEGHSIKT